MNRILAAAASVAFLAGAAQAQAVKTVTTKVTAPAAPTVKTTSSTTVTHTAASLDCSKQADAKGLHGKARKDFRSSCKAAAKAQ